MIVPNNESAQSNGNASESNDRNKVEINSPSRSFNVGGAKPKVECQVLSNGAFVLVQFNDGAFTFHSQWLHDADVEDGPSKKADKVFHATSPTARIRNAMIVGESLKACLHILWDYGKASRFPVLWLRVYATLVAKPHEQYAKAHSPLGWLANSLVIPEIHYSEICPAGLEVPPSAETLAKVYDILLPESAPGIMKVVGLPEPILEGERNGDKAIVTDVLKQLFGSVFKHPRRPADTTFNIASHHEKDVKKGDALPNYDTGERLLAHQDLSHYIYPSRIQGLYALEGESINTFVSCHAALETFIDEAPELLQYLYTAPVSFGRVAHWYQPPLYQAMVDSILGMQSACPDTIKRFRWHPHLSGALLSPYEDFFSARAAHKKFQEILRRDTHLVKLPFKPGDLYVWDNFRILHGREEVLTVPRTSVGQTVTEQAVADKYRELQVNKLLEHINEKWLIHVPQDQLNEMVNLVDCWTT